MVPDPVGAKRYAPSVPGITVVRLSIVASLGLALGACGGEAPPSPTPTSRDVAAPPEPASTAPTAAVPNAAPVGAVASGSEAEGPILGIDTHVDTTQRMLDSHDDIAQRLPNGHLDLPRMREGGLGAAFFSIWVDPDDHPGEAAWARALALIGAVTELADRHPDEATLCRTADEVRRAWADGKIALLMGVEGGHALGSPPTDDAVLERLRELHRLGVRYMTLTWSNDNALGHSSGGRHRNRGLTDLGRRVVHEMNRLGMIVDISHVSDRTFWDVMEVTERPVLASHSSSRSLADHPRNMTDDMIRAVGRQGGAVCINYYTQFIDTDYAARRRALERANADRFRVVHDDHAHSWERWADTNRLARELDPDLGVPTLETLGAHFAHVAELAGPEGVCLGSDFDGVGELPIGLEDVSHLGALRDELARRELPVRAVFSRNVLRVLAAQGGADSSPEPR